MYSVNENPIMLKFNSFQELVEYNSTFGLTAQGCRPSELTLSKGVIKIPLEPTYGKFRVPCLTVRILKDPKKLFVRILWQALFGREHRTIYNLILFNLLDRCNTWTPFTQTVFDVLVLTNRTAKAGSSSGHFQQKLKNVGSILNISNEQVMDRFGKIIESAGYVLPKSAIKAQITEELLSVTSGFIFQQIPKPKTWRGVGYKDHGNISSSLGYEPDEITPYSAADRYKVWELLLSNFRSKYP